MLGSLLVPLVAQCTGAEPSELPTGLPWYFGVAVAVVWFGAVVGVVLLGRRFLLRRLRRRRKDGRSGRDREHERDASAIERW